MKKENYGVLVNAAHKNVVYEWARLTSLSEPEAIGIPLAGIPVRGHGARAKSTLNLELDQVRGMHVPAGLGSVPCPLGLKVAIYDRPKYFCCLGKQVFEIIYFFGFEFYQ